MLSPAVIFESTPAELTPALPKENIYGSIKRLNWIKRHLHPGQRIGDVGCGTGYMVTYPLLTDGHDVYGIDLDLRSVEYGRQILRDAGLPEERLIIEPLEHFDGDFDVIILSEVLEHQRNPLPLLETIAAKLQPGGSLLVTVPNGYGWFELESAVWYRLRIGRLLSVLKIPNAINLIRERITGGYRDVVHPSSLDGSPHVQRFTRRSIAQLLDQAGFEVDDVTGTALFAGPFSAMLFTGVESIMRANNALAGRFPSIASGFMASARKPVR